nr:PREDICTED: AT-hook motif nuclear-localized protein 23-like [Daucus carota subsp. sativus]
MSNSRKFDGSPSTLLPEENHEEPKSKDTSSPSAAPGSESMNGINKPVILEIPSGFDVISCVVQFALHFGLFVTVLTGHGLISDVDVAYSPGAIRPLCSSTCYHIISFSGTYRGSNAASGNIISVFHVQFVDDKGNVMGGRILSHTKAASTVTLVLAVSKNA